MKLFFHVTNELIGNFVYGFTSLEMTDPPFNILWVGVVGSDIFSWDRISVHLLLGYSQHVSRTIPLSAQHNLFSLSSRYCQGNNIIWGVKLIFNFKYTKTTPISPKVDHQMSVLMWYHDDIFWCYARFRHFECCLQKWEMPPWHLKGYHVDR